MQNIHTHTWLQGEHISAEAVQEAQRSRGRPIDLSVDLPAFLRDAEPFERVVVFGLKARLTGFWVPDTYVADFCAQAPHKLIGFAACDPTQPEYMEELRYAHRELGLSGLKMGPMYAGFDPRDSRCDPVYAYCQENSLPVLFHTGTTFNHLAPLAYSRPWIYDEVAIRYPDLRMVLAHLSHPYGQECLAVIRKHPHVYADIAAIYYRPWQFYNAMIVGQEYGVTHKLLFGTDYPFAKAEESIEGLRHVNHVTGQSGLPQVSSEVIEGILERDALSLLGIDA